MMPNLLTAATSYTTAALGKLQFRNDLTLFDSWSGTYSDSPRRIHEVAKRDDPGRTVSWVERQPNSGGVAPHSYAHMRIAHAAGCVVTNNHLPRWYIKPPAARVIQTWHGTPLKRIGFDLESATYQSLYSRYLTSLPRDVGRWDMLLSSSPFMTSTLRSAFRYDGPVLECGSPRNDPIVAASCFDREAIRQHMGLRPDERVVLYAPTYRDDGTDAFTVEALTYLAQKLNDDWRVVFRAHPTQLAGVPHEHPRLLDASSYADMTDLLVVADALITDYSSIMFDYLLTDNPIVLYAPDLVHYRDRLRGFYMDYGTDTPGVVTTTLGDMIDALLAPDCSEDRHGLRRLYAPWDDGHAAERAVKALDGA